MCGDCLFALLRLYKENPACIFREILIHSPSMSYKQAHILNIFIQSLNQEGFGCGKIQVEDGSTREVIVPFTLPGDSVQAIRKRRSRGKWEATLDTLLTPSESRIEPRCQHFGTCGGCRWQHIPYDQQLIEKQILLNKAFEAIGTVNPVIPCTPPWHYRNKMEFSL